MSDSEIVRFLERVAEDEELTRQLADITDGTDPDALRGAIVELAARHGCTFTVEELEEHVSESSEELADEEVERVAGGLGGSMHLHTYSVILREDGGAIIRFGDGAHGRRPTTGSGNVSARYRSGGGSSKRSA